MNDTAGQKKESTELTQLGIYALEARLGQGGMGIVYLATDTKLHRQVAIKVLHPHLLRHENLKDRFRREARMHAKLMHPNIVTLLSLYEDDEHMALVMEMVHGQDLKAYLKTNPQLCLQEKLEISGHILTGLEAAHKFGMVHRDLKPANVLISKTHEVKLMDFGLAKPEQGDDDLTQSGATVGSFRYMSPEQILSQPIDARTDLYAFGILLFQMTTGKLPFDATSNGGEFEIMEKQVRDAVPIPHELNPSIPIALSELILTLLEKNKHDRPKDAVTVRQTIHQILEQLTTMPSPQKVHQNNSATAAPSNREVAQQWFNIARYRIQDFLCQLSPILKKPGARLAAMAMGFVIVGSIVIVLMSSTQGNIQTKSDNPIAATTAHKTTPSTTPASKEVLPAANTANEQSITTAIVKQEVVKPKAIVETSPKVKEKPKAKPKAKPKKKVIRSVAYSRKHSVKRSDKSKVNSKRSHEFRGGKHLFFPELREKSWYTSSKRGETSITFNTPVRLSKIVIHKASVGRLSFKHGYIHLEIQSPSGKWERLFERKNDDVDVKVSIRNVHKHMPKIKAVRLKFKTPQPITIGPIDLLL